MTDKFVKVATYNRNFEAQLAKNLLENEGIASIVSGDLTADMLPFGQAGNGDQIVLQVREDDAQRATGLLAAVAAAKLDDHWEDQAEADVWTCSICGEPISNRLSICYSCQTPRDSIRAAAPRESIVVQPEPTPLTGEEVQKRDEITETPPPEPSPPAPAPLPEMQEEQEIELSLSQTAANDELARRAFLASMLAAVTGVLLPALCSSLLGARAGITPLALATGGLLLVAWQYLLRVILGSGEMSTRGVRYQYGAFLVTALFLLGVFIRCAGAR